MQDFALRSGIAWVGGCKVVDDGASCTYLSLQRPLQAGRFGNDGALLYQRLDEHLRRVSLIQAKLDALAAGERLAMASLDRLRCGVLVCLPNGTIRLANAAAQRLLVARQDLSVRRGMLVAALPEMQGRLQQLLKQACTSGRTRGSALRLTAADPADVLSVIVLPLPPEAQGHAGMPMAMIVLSMPRLQQVPADLMRELYELTAAETMLLAAILGGDSPVTIARQRGVSVATVRTQLHGMLAKTGAVNQAGLVRLAHSLVPVG